MFYSGKFIVCLAIIFIAHWLIVSWRNVPSTLRVLFILAASYYFYALLNWRFLALVFLISTIDFTVARLISTSENAFRRKLLVGVSLVADIGTLAVFKYFNFFSEPLANFFSRQGWDVPPAVLHLVWPAGLSFLAVRSLSYVIDTYRKTKQKPEKTTDHYLDYLAFVSFFPTVEVGPLARAHQLLPQFRQQPTLTMEEGSSATFTIIIGFIKIAVANFLKNNLVDDVFVHPQLYSSTATLAAI